MTRYGPRRRSASSRGTCALTWTRAAPEDEPGPGPWTEIAFGEGDDLVHLRGTSDPANVVTTTRAKWEAFANGVRAGESDHSVTG
ncbi:DUF397 domain-containing protein [Streptomyces sp. NBC_00385]|uniref:DUF397 domain-containing protein n=1 Tax=Streptomyces sp. NBC_00385 TaxID=2975733 RepID=UPI002DD8C573|nr:DUF397 domain-containing protein [Streptomyces sp. NBC_00385]WRZ05016.1 DUF397 domain-containing protein [Streptomyces sp. NBC_00385]